MIERQSDYPRKDTNRLEILSLVCLSNLFLNKYKYFLFTGYKPPHRHTVRKSIKRLHDQHVKLMIDDLASISSIAVTTDFWTHRSKQSYVSLTGHYVDANFQQKSTVLRFCSFTARHFSPLIGHEIERLLTELNIFHKVTSITCDGAPNMIASFDFMSRNDITRIHCLAHKLHLIVCNGLGLWLKKARIVKDNADSDIDADENLSQTIRTVIINEDNDDTSQLLMVRIALGFDTRSHVVHRLDCLCN